MRATLSRWPVYAAILAAYPLVYIAVTNPGQVEGGDVLRIVCLGVAAAAALVAFLRPVVGNWAAAGLATAWIALLFYLYGPANEWWLQWVREGLEQRAAGRTFYNTYPQATHSVAWALLAVAGAWQVRRARGWPWPRITAALNFVAILLTATLLVQAIGHAVRAESPRVRPESETPGPQASAPVRADVPDIYFILLDGYARRDILEKYYGFDNGPFIDGLKARGFQVSDASRSNFYWTFLSLGSALNLDYVQSLLGNSLEEGSRDRSAMYRLLRDNRAARFLRERGYRFVQLQSTWGATARNEFADEFLPCHGGAFGNEYTRAVADASWLRALESKASHDVASCHLRNFEVLESLPRSPGPKFVLAHFVPPHHPYLFDREGRVLRHATLSDQFEFQKKLWEDRAAYVEQLRYVNRRIGGVVDRLIRDSARPPVIVLVSDHGPNLREGLSRPEERYIRLSNLTAMYLPGAPPGYLPADATPVNHLRRVFNLYFDAGLPILADRYFVSEYAAPFRLREVGPDYRQLHEEAGF